MAPATAPEARSKTLTATLRGAHVPDRDFRRVGVDLQGGVRRHRLLPEAVGGEHLHLVHAVAERARVQAQRSRRAVRSAHAAVDEHRVGGGAERLARALPS